MKPRISRLFSLVALVMLFAITSHAQSVAGKWELAFTGGSSITSGAANLTQTKNGNLSSPFFSGEVAGEFFQNYEIATDSSCSNSGWAQTQPSGVLSDSNFSLTIPIDAGGSYRLTGKLKNGVISGTYTSDCNHDSGSFTATQYAPVAGTYTGTVTGTDDNANSTVYNASVTLSEAANFQVTGSITLRTTSGGATCYGTMPIFGPATGALTELGGSNSNVQLIGLLFDANNTASTSLAVETLIITSSACGNDPITGTVSSKKGEHKHRHPRKSVR